MSLGMDFFEREKTGKLVARMTSDMDALQELVQMGLVMFVQNGLLFVGAILVIFLMSWKLAICTLVVVPPVVIASRWFRKASNKAYLLVRDRIGQNLSTLQEGLAGVRVVRRSFASGRSPAASRRRTRRSTTPTSRPCASRRSTSGSSSLRASPASRPSSASGRSCPPTSSRSAPSPPSCCT